MAKKRISVKEIQFRSATPADAVVAGRLLFESFPKKATYIIGLGNEARAKKILVDIFSKPGHRLSYESTQIVLYDGAVIGALTAYPGNQMEKLNRHLYLHLIKQYKIRGKFALILRGLPLIFIKETARDEYFLSNLVVKRQYRCQGVGEKMLEAVEQLAKEAGYSRVSLIVNLENQSAQRFYERYGYEVKAIIPESSRRVANLGRGSQRRVKELTS
jgi:ribosomal protein S18 acetylase RimI-like enzyme